MKERPILFKTEMVKAILEGRKTMTRRIVKDAEGWDYNWRIVKIKEEHKDGQPRYEMRCGSQYSTQIFKCPYGKVGDVLWVKETFAQEYGGGTLYKASHSHMTPDGKWKSSLFMPKGGARIWLQITDIKVERLQDISEGDAKAEGANRAFQWIHDNKITIADETHLFYSAATHKLGFQEFWQSIHGEESWQINPYVWAINFEVLSTTGKPII